MEGCGFAAGHTKDIKMVLDASSLGAQCYRDRTMGLSEVSALYTVYVRESDGYVDIGVEYRIRNHMYLHVFLPPPACYIASYVPKSHNTTQNNWKD